MPGSVNTEFGGDSPSEDKSWQLQPSDIARVVIDLLPPRRTEPPKPRRNQTAANPKEINASRCTARDRAPRHRRREDHRRDPTGSRRFVGRSA